VLQPALFQPAPLQSAFLQSAFLQSALLQPVWSEAVSSNIAGGKLTVANALASLFTAFTSPFLSSAIQTSAASADLSSFNPDCPISSVLTPLLLSHPSFETSQRTAQVTAWRGTLVRWPWCVNVDRSPAILFRLDPAPNRRFHSWLARFTDIDRHRFRREVLARLGARLALSRPDVSRIGRCRRLGPLSPARSKRRQAHDP
jgi:hypothetical protein